MKVKKEETVTVEVKSEGGLAPLAAAEEDNAMNLDESQDDDDCCAKPCKKPLGAYIRFTFVYLEWVKFCGFFLKT